MDVFSLREGVVGDYGSYVRSFLEIRDERVGEFVHKQLDEGALWPDPLLQLNPSFAPGPALVDLVAEGLLHEQCLRIFADKEVGLETEDGMLSDGVRLKLRGYFEFLARMETIPSPFKATAISERD